MVHSKKQIAPVVSFRNSQGELVRGTITNLQRRILVMEIYNPYSIVQVSEILSDLKVKAGTADVYHGRAVVTSMVSTGLTAVVSVALTDEWRELSTLPTDSGSFRNEAQIFIKDWDDRSKIAENYQFAVNELRTFLTEVSRWVAQLDLTADLPEKGNRLDDDAFSELAEPILLRIRSYMHDLGVISEKVEPELSAAHRAYAQNALHPLLLRSPFVHRTLTKPLGYAGDYEMVNQILGEKRKGPNTYFQIINACFLSGYLAQAHRNRVTILFDFLVKQGREAIASGRKRKILNVGCGPAAEIQRFCREFERPEMLEFKLVDFNAETLSHTEKKIDAVIKDRGLEVDIKYVHQSVHDLIKRNIKVPSEEAFDAVYCAGLFDYLSDKVCNRLLAFFSSQSVPGGNVLFTNVHSKNPERYFVMEHVLEWFLIYRDEEDMERVSLQTDMQVIKTYVDNTGVNVFAEAEVRYR